MEDFDFAMKLKPLEWFKENAFEDHDGDYHPTAELRDYYDKYHRYRGDDTGEKFYKPIYWYSIQKEIYYVKNETDSLEYYKWAIDEVFYPETHPQYFI